MKDVLIASFYRKLRENVKVKFCFHTINFGHSFESVIVFVIQRQKFVTSTLYCVVTGRTHNLYVTTVTIVT